jgi:hypothetical protein
MQGRTRLAFGGGIGRRAVGSGWYPRIGRSPLPKWRREQGDVARQDSSRRGVG